MMQSCAQCQASFEITDEDLQFYDKISPVFGGTKYEIPPPTLCPDCRQQRRLAYRNERTLHRRLCSGSKRSIVATYPEDTDFPVYDHSFFFSDQWDVLSYGREFDFNRPFFEQYYDLQKAVPRLLNYSLSNENAEYGNLASWNKDCYMCFEADNNQDCLYCDHTFRCKDTVDCTHITESEVCYECVDTHNGYDLQFCIDCRDCSSSRFLKDCIGCRNCFGCTSLRNKEYYIFNESHTKEEYAEKISQYNLASNTRLQEQWELFVDSFKDKPVKYRHGTQNEDVHGDYVYNSKNCYQCFDCDTLRDCKYCCNFERSNTSYDIDTYGGIEGCERTYECHSVGRGAFDVCFGNNVYQNIHDSYYCDGCAFSSYLFGCISVHNHKYCILNRQYTEDEYTALAPKIIEHMKREGEWGEFFPVQYSPFSYNETLAHEYYPLTKKEAEKKNFQWRDTNDNIPDVEKVIDADQLPDAMQDVPDDVLNWAIKCSDTKRPFKLTKQELEFYRKMNITIPRLHPDVRYQKRMSLRNPRKLWSRQCAKCSKDIQTTYAPERPEIVYCEECYLKEVY